MSDLHDALVKAAMTNQQLGLNLKDVRIIDVQSTPFDPSRPFQPIEVEMVVVHDGWRSRVRLIADLCEFFFANGSNVIGSLSQQKDTVDPFDPTPNDIGGLSFSINDFVFIRDKARKAWNWILLHTKYRE